MPASSLVACCWALQLVLFTVLLDPGNGQSLDGISRSGLPGLHEIAENALHLYGLPIAERQPIRQLSNNVYEDRLYKHTAVNFTCSGNITKLMFIAWKGNLANDATDTREKLWPQFSILRLLRQTDTRIYYRQLELLVSSHNPVPIDESGNIGVYEIQLSTNNTFEAGDYLGLWQPLYHNTSSRVAVTVLHQGYGGYSYYDYSLLVQWNVVWENSDGFFPLVSIETGTNCTQGFLNNQSLEMIIETLRNNQTSNSLFFSSRSQQYITPNTAFISLGILTKWTFAARFNHSNVKLPELQIWRKQSRNNFIKIHGISIEPRRTGYLNVFEFDLSHTVGSVHIQPGDVFGVYQPREDEARYSLAFLRSQDGPSTYFLHAPTNATDVNLSAISVKMQPLVTAAVEEAESDGLSTTYAMEEGLLTNSTVFDSWTTLEQGGLTNNITTIIVSGILSGACVLLVLMLITVTVILIIVIIRHKRFTPRTSDTIIAHIHNVNETHSVSSETEETGLLIYNNEAYDLDRQKFTTTKIDVTDTKPADSESASYEDVSGGQDIYDYITET